VLSDLGRADTTSSPRSARSRILSATASSSRGDTDHDVFAGKPGAEDLLGIAYAQYCCRGHELCRVAVQEQAIGEFYCGGLRWQ
jgi:hypothetical protein